MPFLDEDVIVRAVDANTWELVEPITYIDERHSFTVPAGFTTDFATIPKIFGWLMPAYGRYTKAAILHDYLYETNTVNRAVADTIFRNSMYELGVPFLRRWIMWTAVRTLSQFADTTVSEFLLWLLIAIPTLIFIAIPAVVTFTWLAMFWVLEWVTCAALRLLGYRDVRRPRFWVIWVRK